MNATGTDLVKAADAGIAATEERQRALAELNDAAEKASTAGDAHEIFVKGKALSDLLARMSAPFEEARLAGKASVVAARRLGRMLNEMPTNVGRPPRRSSNFVPSERQLAANHLNLTRSSLSTLMRVGRLDDAAFQRYIQRTDTIPCVSGALSACEVGFSRSRRDGGDTWRVRRRTRAGVKPASNPSLDEGYSLIVRALGHLCAKGVAAKGVNNRDLGLAIDHLYAAEDLLKAYRGGYV